MDKIKVNEKEYSVIKLLGRGKGGYSYLVDYEGIKYVLKQIHHEPCDYYTFGNKIESELNDYKRLLDMGIKMPLMIDIDIPNERIIKEYIEGPTIFDLVKEDLMDEIYFHQIRKMASQAYSYGMNIDYFPTNFVVKDREIYYVDYECNKFMEEWNFENWGIKYWYKSKEFIDYLNNK